MQLVRVGDVEVQQGLGVDLLEGHLALLEFGHGVGQVDRVHHFLEVLGQAGLASAQQAEGARRPDELQTFINPDAKDVNTKLDLARAYLEMGDREGAREILQEVLGEGDSKQKSEADKLLAHGITFMEAVECFFGE